MTYRSNLERVESAITDLELSNCQMSWCTGLFIKRHIAINTKTYKWIYIYIKPGPVGRNSKALSTVLQSFKLIRIKFQAWQMFLVSVHPMKGHKNQSLKRQRLSCYDTRSTYTTNTKTLQKYTKYVKKKMWRVDMYSTSTPLGWLFNCWPDLAYIFLVYIHPIVFFKGIVAPVWLRP